jgi:hypothetical protein
MALPDPECGLVISYAYLWRHESERGIEEGRKDRPCAIVLSVSRAGEAFPTVTVAPITHAPPGDPRVAIEIPAPIKRHLGWMTPVPGSCSTNSTSSDGRGLICGQSPAGLASTPKRRPARARLEFLRSIEEQGLATEAGIDPRLEQAAHL